MIANSNVCGDQTGFITGSGRDYGNLERTPYVKATGINHSASAHHCSRGGRSLDFPRKAVNHNIFHASL